MTDNEKDVVEGLRLAGDSLFDNAADLIESLSAELEQVERERDEAWKVVESVSRQNEIMAGALERVKKEREVQHD